MKKCPIKHLFAVASIALAPCAFGATFNVSPDTTDTTAESSATFRATLAAAADGAVIQVGTGVYYLAEQCSLTNAVTVCAANGVAKEDVVFKYLENKALYNNDGHRLFLVKNADAVLSGVTIDGGYLNGSGANVYLESGVVTNCIIRNGKQINSAGGGGGVCIYGRGTLANCVISNNASKVSSYENYFGGGGIYTREGTVNANVYSILIKNCLVVNNSVNASGGNRGGAGIFIPSIYGNGAEVVNCTIVGNKTIGTSSQPCAGVVALKGRVRNCLIGENEILDGAADSQKDCGGTLSLFKNCAAPVQTEGGVVVEKAVMSLAGSDYRPVFSSPAVDALEVESWMEETIDIVGNPRVSNGRADMGAYELLGNEVGATFTVNKKISFMNDDVTLKVFAKGLPADAQYAWDLDGDGVIYETVVSTPEYTHSFSRAGEITISLKIVAADGVTELCTVSEKFTITVASKYVYVSSLGNNTAPYHSWETAAKTLEDAISQAPSYGEVIVSNGLYEVTKEQALTTPLTIRGYSQNPNDVVIYRSSSSANKHRLFNISNADVVLSGLTIEGGCANGSGGNIYMNGGMVTNCIIRNGAMASGGDCGGGGVAIQTFGTLTHCIISNNFGYATSRSDWFGGGGVYTKDGTVDSILIQNCLVVSNTVQTTDARHGGGGIFIPAQYGSGAKVVGCTIAHNKAIGSSSNPCGGIVAMKGANNGSILNCLVYGNTAESAAEGYDASCPDWYGANDNFFKRCAAEAAMNDACLALAEDPFKGAEKGNFKLKTDSPAVNAIKPNKANGETKETLLAGLGYTVDLAGNPRIVGKGLDIGCYECQSVSGFRIILR